MINITVGDIVKATQGVLLNGDSQIEIKHLCIDSRNVEPESLFIPIIGEKTDAHTYIEQTLCGNNATKTAAIATLTSEHKELTKGQIAVNPKACWIYVKDTVKALHQIGHLCRSKVTIPAVGVTGSVGKTTTREMIAHAMASDLKIFKTDKNYNSQIGVPITMSLMDNDCDYAVLELGMNVPGELGMISQMAKIHIGVITNIGVAHIEFFGTQDRIAIEKLTISKGLDSDGILVLNGDDPYLYQYGKDMPFETIFYGFNKTNDIYADSLIVTEDKISFVAHVNPTGKLYKMYQNDIPVILTLPGRHNVSNALATLAVCILTGVDVSKAAKALISFKGFINRLQIKKDAQGITYIDDTYNASPTSMKAGLDVLCDHSCRGRRIAVLGDMFELGEKSPEYHYQVGLYAASKIIDQLVCVGTNAKYIGQAVLQEHSTIEVHYCADIEEARDYLQNLIKCDDLVYFKASNGMHFKSLIQSIKAGE